ncbi:MAG: carbohydrate-binding family 9-like protein [Pirellulaceae bacterium]
MNNVATILMFWFASNLGLLSQTVASAADPPPRYTIYRTSTPIEIDGRLDEAAWKQTPSVGDFHFPWWQAGRKEQTVAKMLWNDKYLYVSYHCQDAHVWATHTEHDSPVYQDDCVELFTAPNPQQPVNYFNIEMNVKRAFLDRHHPQGPGKAEVAEWSAQGVLIATHVDGTLNDDSDTDGSWVLEAAIPFANFQGVTGRPHPRHGDVWHLNLNRLGGKTNPQYSQWSPGKTKRPAFHAPDTFGRVVYANQPVRDPLPKASGYQPVPNFLKIPDSLKLGRCSAVAINSKGNIYLFHRGDQPICCFSSSGKFIRSWGDGLIGMAHGLRIDRDDNVWATDIGHHMVFKFSAEGKLLMALGTSDKPGTAGNQFNKPTDVAFGPHGEFFVSDGYGNTRVMKFAANGQLVKMWGEPGKEPGQFDLPHSIVVDAKNRVLVGDRENDRIQVFDLDGNRLAIWNGVAPFGLALDRAQRVFVADGRANQLVRLDAQGKVDLRWGKEGARAGEFNLPHMLAIDDEGNVYVAEVGGERFQKFKPVSGR